MTCPDDDLSRWGARLLGRVRRLGLPYGLLPELREEMRVLEDRLAEAGGLELNGADQWVDPVAVEHGRMAGS